VLLDRDGVLVEDVGYLSSPSQLRVLPGVAWALASLSRAGFALAVVSNQSGVARGLFSEDDVRAVNAALATRLARAGARVEAWLYCPHHPTQGSPPYRQRCECRKPAPGLLWRARDELGLDLRRSWVVGDKLTDVEAAQRAGCRAVLVGSPSEASPAVTLPSLAEAARWILARAPQAQVEAR
jgi:D-glycero-D-manno-heptose 1,7-bisphosphate phosphatase